MSCTPCTVAAQFVLNVAIAVDRLASSLLGGSPNVTLSQRTARCRLAGQKWASAACWLLTKAGHLLGAQGDHCTNSLTPGTDGLELWDWSPSVPQPPNTTGV
jgi:hypothetical protein